MPIEEIEPTKVIAFIVSRALANHDSDELLAVLPAAEKDISDQKELLFEAFFAAGEFKQTQHDYSDSILHFNKAKKFNPTQVLVFDRLVECFDSFYSDNKELFVKSDLWKLLPVIKGLTDYYSTLPDTDDSQKRVEVLMSRMAYRLNFVAPEGIEGKLTYRVNVIVEALEKDVPMEQVKKEVAKYIADLLRKNNS